MNSSILKHEKKVNTSVIQFGYRICYSTDNPRWLLNKEFNEFVIGDWDIGI